MIVSVLAFLVTYTYSPYDDGISMGQIQRSNINRKFVVTIDPGHPSENGVGTKGKTQTELEVCWDMATRLATILTHNGVTVYLTKSTRDEMVTNRRRAEIANQVKSNLSIRLHCDAATSSGFSVYYPDRAGTVKGHSGPSKNVLKSSKDFATRFYSSLSRKMSGKLNNRGLFTEQSTAIGAKQGALTGSIFSTVPVFLIEMVVLTNAKDEKWIADASNRDFFANSIAGSIMDSLSDSTIVESADRLDESEIFNESRDNRSSRSKIDEFLSN